MTPSKSERNSGTRSACCPTQAIDLRVANLKPNRHRDADAHPRTQALATKAFATATHTDPGAPALYALSRSAQTAARKRLVP